MQLKNLPAFQILIDPVFMQSEIQILSINLVSKEEESAELSRRGDIDMGSVSEYDIQTPSTPIHNADEWKNLSPEDRRKMAVEFYYSLLALCQKKSISNCASSDAKFIAKVCVLIILKVTTWLSGDLI